MSEHDNLAESGYARLLDADDDAVYVQAFVLADAVRRFLARNRTQAVIAAGLLDGDVVRDLVDAHEAMKAARMRRVENARSGFDLPD